MGRVTFQEIDVEIEDDLPPPSPEAVLVPHRWRMMFLITSGVVLSYTLRVNISVAVIAMQEDLHWQGNEKGLILSAFYVGYAIGQVPAAFAAQYFGAKQVLGFSVLYTALLSLMFPVVIVRSFPAGLLLRTLIGLSASATFPSCYYFYKSWVPKSEKTIMIPFVNSGKYLGEVVAFSLSGILVKSDISVLKYSLGGWAAAFWVFALVAGLWYPCWQLCAYERPEDNPAITQEELDFIRKDQMYSTVKDFNIEQEQSTEIEWMEPESSRLLSAATEGRGGYQSTQVTTGSEGSSPTGDGDYSPRSARARTGSSVAFSIIADSREHEHDAARRIPWGHFLRNRTSLVLLLTWWVVAWIGFMMLSEIPSFLMEQLGYNMHDAGFVSMLPYIAQLVSSLGFGYVFNYLEQEWQWTTRQVRVWAQVIALGGSSSCLLACSFMATPATAVLLLVMALFFYGATQSGLSCAFLDVSPNYSCSLNSLANMVGAIAGIVSPLVVSQFTSGYWIPVEWGWSAVFALTAAQCVVAIYFWCGTDVSEIVPELNSPRPRKTVQYKEWFPWLRV